MIFHLAPYDCDIIALAECIFVDSMRVLQNSGYKRAGLYALCQDINAAAAAAAVYLGIRGSQTSQRNDSK